MTVSTSRTLPTAAVQYVRCYGLLIVLFCVAGCGLRRPEPGGSRVHCPDGSMRLSVSCQSVSQLKARVFEANVGLPKIKLGLSVAYEEQAVAQVSDATQQLALELDGKCAQYNACAIDAAGWVEAEERLRRHLRLVAELNAKPGPQLGDSVWANAVPELARQRLQLQVQVEARAADGSFVAHRSGEPLASGRALRFMLRSNIPAYVYLLLLSSQGRAEQLFPQPALQEKNPIAAGRTVLLPPPGVGTFVLDDRPGIEHIQILASTHPLTDIEARLATLGARGAEGGSVLRAIADLLCAPLQKPGAAAALSTSSVTCQNKTTRGLVLVPEPAAGASAGSGTTLLQAEPGDDVVLLQHEIEHVSAS